LGSPSRYDNDVPVLSDDALVLDSHPFRDRHLVLALLTRTNGLMRGVLRGARGGKAPAAGAAQILSLVRVTSFISSRAELATFRELDLLTSSYPLAAEIERAAAAAVVAELLVTFCPLGEPAPRRFRLGQTLLEGLLRGADPHTAVAYGQFWSLLLGGVLPALDAVPLADEARRFLVACRRLPLDEIEATVPESARRWLDERVRVEAERPLRALDFLRHDLE